MNEYICDGKVHRLNRSFDYIVNKYPGLADSALINNIHNTTYRRYAEYLYDFDKRQCIEYIMEAFEKYIDSGLEVPQTNFIHKKPEEISILNEYGTIALKFLRQRTGDSDD